MPQLDEFIIHVIKKIGEIDRQIEGMYSIRQVHFDLHVTSDVNNKFLVVDQRPGSTRLKFTVQLNDNHLIAFDDD